MNKEDWDKLQEVFHEACELPEQERLRFVESAAEGKETLAGQLLLLLRKDADRSFLDGGIQVINEEAFDERGGEVGPYRLLQKLGEGGMGFVYLAEREDWQSKVAVKIPRNVWFSGDHLRRFADEQRLLSRLVHASIARIYESGVLPSGTPWFAMEYVAGEPITGYCQTHQSSVQQRLQLVLCVCDAVEHAHTQAIIHRDLKPSNILVTASGEVKLLDFGIAKQLDDSGLATLTRVGLHPITLAYAAPEQVLANEISTRTDVYALGVILYELLAGKLPFDMSESTPLQAEQMLREKEPERPSFIGSSADFYRSGVVPPTRSQWADLDVLILTAMHKDPSKRYGSVNALKRDIHHYLNNEPLEARPDTLGYRVAKFLKRRRVPISIAAAAISVLIAVIAFYRVRLSHARDAAVAEAARTRMAREFTDKLFSGRNNDVAPSKDLLVIDLLDRGLQTADNLKSDPVQQGQLYSTLGSLFANLGEFKKADSTLHSAYRILSAADPKSHELAEVLVQLGVLYSAQAQDAHAEACMRKAIAIEESITPREERLIYKYKTALASALVRKYPEKALDVLTPLIHVPASTADDELKSDVWNLLTTGYSDLGEYAQAEPFARRALEYDERTKPANHPDVALELMNLGYIENHLGQYRDAEESYRRALRIDESWYPKHHPETGDVMRFLGEVLLNEHHLNEAAVLARQALEDEQKAYGDAHPRTAFALQLNGRIALERGELKPAEAFLKKDVELSRALDARINLPKALMYLGDTYNREKQYTKAEECYRESVASLLVSSLEPPPIYSFIGELASRTCCRIESRQAGIE